MTSTTAGHYKPKRVTPTGMPALLTIEQVADATGLCQRTIRRRISDGTLRGHRIGPRMIRIERDSVLALLASPMDAA